MNNSGRTATEAVQVEDLSAERDKNINKLLCCKQKDGKDGNNSDNEHSTTHDHDEFECQFIE